MITFNGKSSRSSDLGITKVATATRPLMATTRDNLLEIRDRDGAFDFGYSLEPLFIPIRLYLRTSTPAEERGFIRAIAAWLSLRDAKPLIFSDEPDKQYYARISGEPVYSGKATRRFVDFTFLCPDPHAYSATTKTKSPNLGTAPTPVLITTTMNVTEISSAPFTITQGNQQIKIGKMLKSGDVIVADTAKGTVDVNGVDVRQYATFDSDLRLVLPVGTFSLAVNKGILAFSFRERWL